MKAHLPFDIDRTCKKKVGGGATIIHREMGESLIVFHH